MTETWQDTTTTVSTNLGALHVRVVGTGPTAFLWHSLFVDSTSWSRVEADLAQHRTLVMIDAPGHGRSAPPPRRFTFADCAAAARTVLDSLQVDAVDWLGSAWGGRVGMLFAANHPERVRTLVTLSSAPWQLPRLWRHLTSSLLLPYRTLGPLAPVTEAVMTSLLGERTRRRDVDAAILVSHAFLSAERHGLARAVRNTLARQEDLDRVVEQVSVPTLVVAGGDDFTFTADDAAHVASRMPCARADVLDGVFRLAPVERPTETVKLVLDHWETSRTCG